MIKKDYETLLTYQQKVKYKAAIRQGYFDDYHSLDWRHTFWGAYIWRYPGRVKVLTRIKELFGKLPDWEDITDDNLKDIVDMLGSNYAPNSVRTICAEICALLHENGSSKEIPTYAPQRVLKAKKSPVHATYLDEWEIKKLEAYQPKKTSWCYVKRLFMIECMTGARKSDCERMTLENIIEEKGHRFIRYVSQKNNHEVTVPLDVRLVKYLVPVGRNEPTAMTTYTYITILQRMCKECGIDARVKVFTAGQEKSGYKFQFVSSHTGRRSFATNLAKRGVSLEQIALMMGHMNGNTPNIAMTQRYIVGKLTIDSSVIALFERGHKDY